MMQKEVADRISAQPNTKVLRQFVDCGAVLYDGQGCLCRAADSFVASA